MVRLDEETFYQKNLNLSSNFALGNGISSFSLGTS